MPRTTRIGTFLAMPETSVVSGSSAATGERTAWHHEHNRNITHLQLPFYAESRLPFYVKIRAKTCTYTDFSGTRAQLSKTGQSVCSQRARSSKRWPLQRFKPAAA